MTALSFCLILLASTGCAVPMARNPAPALTAQFGSTLAIPPVGTAMVSSATDIATVSSPLPATVAAPDDFCADPQPVALISRLKTALQTSDGMALALLLDPIQGMEARLYRNGRIVRYDQASAKFLFVSTFVVDWGAAPGSGLETKGSFHELLVPQLRDVLNNNYVLSCNQIHVGGTTYTPSWPYRGIDFYSVFDPGTQANGYLDWRTWLLGIHYITGKPYLSAIMRFQWEP